MELVNKASDVDVFHSQLTLFLQLWSACSKRHPFAKEVTGKINHAQVSCANHKTVKASLIAGLVTVFSPQVGHLCTIATFTLNMTETLKKYLLLQNIKIHMRGVTDIYVGGGFLILVDALIAFISCFFAFNFIAFQSDAIISDASKFAYFYTAISVALAHALGLHNPRQLNGQIRLIAKILGVVTVSILIVVMITTSVESALADYFVYVTVFAVSVGLMITTREFLRFLFLRKERYIVVFRGSDKFMLEADSLIDNQSNNLVFCMDQANIKNQAENFSWSNVDELVLESSSFMQDLDSAELLEITRAKVRITYYSDFVESLLLRVPVDYIDLSWLARLQYGWRGTDYQELSKRAFDIFFGAIGLILSLPLIAIFSVFVKLDSPGPAIYRQVRVGERGATFTMFKLRSMGVDSERNGATWAADGDVRITKVGAFLRKTRLDELPQFWNILIGDMSFIGPRPERPEFVSHLTENIPNYDFRHLVKPGLSGWAQINYHYGASVEEAKKKLELDLYYVKNRSIVLDIHIALRTLLSMCKGSR